MATRSILCVVALLAAPAVARGAETQKRTVAVHPLKGLGVEADTIAALEGFLRAEVAAVPGIKVPGAKRSRAAADKVACDGKEACIAEFARALGAELGIYGVVGGLGDSYNITLKGVIADRAVIERKIQVRVGGKREVLIDGIRGAAYQLLRPDLYVGSIDIRVPVDGAEVYVDGRFIGRTPLEGAVDGLPPGQHALKIVKAGFSDFDKFVEIRFKRTVVVTVDLEGSTVSGVIYQEAEAPPLVAFEAPLEAPPRGPPPPRTQVVRYAAYATLGLGAVGFGLGAGFGLSATGQSAALSKRFKENGGPVAADGIDFALFKNTRRNSVMFYVIASSMAILGGTLFAVDVLEAGSTTPTTVTLVPVGPGGPGVGLVVTF